MIQGNVAGASQVNKEAAVKSNKAVTVGKDSQGVQTTCIIVMGLVNTCPCLVWRQVESQVIWSVDCISSGLYGCCILGTVISGMSLMVWCVYKLNISETGVLTVYMGVLGD